MQTQNTQSVNKMLSFSTALYDFALKKANAKGIGFQEYIRYLVVKEKEKEDEPLYMVDDETDRKIQEAMEEGEYTDFDDPEEAINYLKRI